MNLTYAAHSDVDEWMSLVKSVRYNFPGLETDDGIEDYRQTLIKFIGKNQAICVKIDEKITGVLLFSRSQNMICCLAVDPNYRRRGVASMLLENALSELNTDNDITVSTFRENDEKGKAPRALYKKFGFAEDELIEEFGYPNQKFVLRGRK